MRFLLTLVVPCLFFPALIGCGPNVLSARGTVLNPTYRYKSAEEDPEAPRNIPRKLTIRRKESRVAVQNTIVGAYGAPRALGYLDETAEMFPMERDSDRLTIDVTIYSVYKDELSEGSFEYWLEFPDGTRLKGEVHRQDPIVDLTQKVDGRHTEYTLVKENGQTSAYPHQVFVQNDFELFRRKTRIVFRTGKKLTKDTTYVVFVAEGYQRQWRWRFDFTLDPYVAVKWSTDPR